MVVARYRMICLVLLNSHLFPLSCGAGSAVPREGFDLSVTIPCIVARLSEFGLPSLFVTVKQYVTFLSSGVHIFKHFYL